MFKSLGVEPEKSSIHEGKGAYFSNFSRNISGRVI